MTVACQQLYLKIFQITLSRTLSLGKRIRYSFKRRRVDRCLLKNSSKHINEINAREKWQKLDAYERIYLNGMLSIVDVVNTTYLNTGDHRPFARNVKIRIGGGGGRVFFLLLRSFQTRLRRHFIGSQVVRNSRVSTPVWIWRWVHRWRCDRRWWRRRRRPARRRRLRSPRETMCAECVPTVSRR